MKVDAHDFHLTFVRFRRGGAVDVELGLLGFASCLVDDWAAISCIAVRRTRRGSIAFSWPSKPDRRGRRRCVFMPVGDARTAFESALLEALHPFLSRAIGARSQPMPRTAAAGVATSHSSRSAKSSSARSSAPRTLDAAAAPRSRSLESGR